MALHAKFGPSGADRWMTCTKSMELIDDLKASGEIPEYSSSVFADEGSVAHQVREDCLLLGLDAHEFVGQTINWGGVGYEITDEMAEHLQGGIDWIREMLDEVHVEVVVKLDPWLPNQFGTMDAGGVFGDTLLVSDLKYGAGVPVSAVGNRQMRLYGLGLWHHLGRPPVTKVLFNIDQPRAGKMKFWEITLEELLEFGKEASDAYLKIKTGDTEFAPSEKGCKWCPAKDAASGCPAYNTWMYEVFAEAFSDDAELLDKAIFTDPALITPSRRWFIVRNSGLAKKWLAKLHEDCLTTAVDGKPDPGSKAVLGPKGNRVYSDAGKAEGILIGALNIGGYKPQDIIGITAAEKLLKPNTRKEGHPEAWEALQKILTQSDGKPILVPEDDPRDEVTPLADEFDDL